jgi:hypothetical protein
MLTKIATGEISSKNVSCKRPKRFLSCKVAMRQKSSRKWARMTLQRNRKHSSKSSYNQIQQHRLLTHVKKQPSSKQQPWQNQDQRLSFSILHPLTITG